MAPSIPLHPFNLVPGAAILDPALQATGVDGVVSAADVVVVVDVDHNADNEMVTVTTRNAAGDRATHQLDYCQPAVLLVGLCVNAADDDDWDLGVDLAPAGAAAPA